MIDVTNIGKLRKTLGITQINLAKAAGVSQSLIAKIESQKLDPTFSKVKKISNALEALSKKQELKASAIMVKSILFASPTDKIVDVITIMNKKGISQGPIIKNNNIIGILNDKNILNHITNPDFKKLKTSEIMSEPPPIVSESTPISAIEQLLKHYSVVLVRKTSGGYGIISTSDIIKKII